MLQRCFSCLLLAVALSSTAHAQDDNLLKNGHLAEAPNEKTPGTEPHAGAYEIPVPAGSTLVPGWNIGGTVYVTLWRQGQQPKGFQMRNGSDIWQNVATVPQGHYRFHCVIVGNAEGPASQPVTIKIGSLSKVIEARPRATADIEFSAEPNRLESRYQV